MQGIADSERNMQLMIRAIAKGSLSDRDRLFEYTIGEFYQELSLYLQESEQKKKETDELLPK